jgi:hypothetical protein
VPLFPCKMIQRQWSEADCRVDEGVVLLQGCPSPGSSGGEVCMLCTPS